MTDPLLKPYIVPATRDHVDMMAPHMRGDDALEMWAMGAWLPVDALTYSFEQSTEAFTVIDPCSDVPVMMFGIGRGDILDPRRSIWLLGTEQINRIKRPFLQESGKVLHKMGAGSTVYNYVLSSNQLSLRWLRWLGFNILDAKPFGWLNKDFHYVEKVIPQCVPSQQQP